MVYEELRGDIEPFLKLYKLAKRKGMGIKQVVNLLEMSNNDLPDIQCRYERLKEEVNTLECNKQQSHRTMAYFNNKIEMKSKALTSYRLSCIRERRQVENLHNEKARIANLVSDFKNNNEDYLNIKQAAEDKVKDVLTNSKLILKLATFSVIESLRSNPELYNFVIHDNSYNTTISYGSNYLSLVSKQQQQSFNDSYTALILGEAEKIYNDLSIKLTNTVMAAAAVAIRISSLPSIGNNNNKQKLPYNNDNT